MKRSASILAAVLTLGVPLSAFAADESTPGDAVRPPPAPAPPPPPSTVRPAPYGAYSASDAEHRDQFVLGPGVHHGAYGAPEAKVTSFTGDAAMLVGGHIGWVIDRSFVLGLSGFALATSHSPVPELAPPNGTTRLGAGYGGIRIAYLHQPEKVVHFGFGTIIGAGGITALTRDRNDDSKYESHHGAAFFVFEPNAEIELNVHRNMRLAFIGSYRLTSSTDQPGLKASDLSGPAAGLAFRIGVF